MNTALEALLFPYRRGLLSVPAPDTRLLFLNAEMTPALKEMALTLTLVQPRYDKARVLINAGYDIAASPAVHDVVWALPGKDMEEMQYLLAVAVKSVRAGGIVVAAAPNDAGGKRLAECFESLGLAPHEESKNKSRVVYAAVESYNRAQADLWRVQGEEQPVLNGRVLACPGLHGWNKVDAGSEILMRHVPPLKGHVADFGCGWGYLALQAIAVSPDLKQLSLMDVDSRAVSLAQRNIAKQAPGLPINAFWTDLANPEQKLGPFDAILLNPPFHEGTQSVPALGLAIITTAARSLTSDGTLYLVANRHLPYEKTLHALFKDVAVLADEGGFKALACRL